MALCAELLVQSGLFANNVAARIALEVSLSSGKAAEIFQRMVATLGGPHDLVENPDKYLDVAPVCLPAPAMKDGFVKAMDTRALGMAVVALGGGRRRAADSIDFAVGLSAFVSRGANVRAGAPLAFVHARSRDAADAAVQAIQHAITIGDSAPSPLAAVYQAVRGQD
jgi:thymidine phosphorylase